MKRKDPRELHLQYSEARYEHDSARRMIVRKNTRGLLQDVEVRVEQPEIFSPQRFIPPFKIAIEALCEELRGILDSADLPTDRYPIMPFELDDGYEPLEHTTPSGDIWWYVVEESTEPLTKERIAADLLFALLRILKQKLSNEHLAEVYKGMQAYSLYKIATDFHSLAIMGEAAKSGRSHGPKVRKSKTQAIRELIWEAARRHWVSHPNYSGRRQATADAIAGPVNAEILQRSLSSKPLTPKAISDHISVGLKAGSLSTK
jgi:hypothetical protein